MDTYSGLSSFRFLSGSLVNLRCLGPHADTGPQTKMARWPGGPLWPLIRALDLGAERRLVWGLGGVCSLGPGGRPPGLRSPGLLFPGSSCQIWCLVRPVFLKPWLVDPCEVLGLWHNLGLSHNLGTTPPVQATGCY